MTEKIQVTAGEAYPVFFESAAEGEVLEVPDGFTERYREAMTAWAEVTATLEVLWGNRPPPWNPRGGPVEDEHTDPKARVYRGGTILETAAEAKARRKAGKPDAVRPADA